jgi:predicted acetyltransferase
LAPIADRQRSTRYTARVLDPIAPSQAAVLRQLFELYCYDFSEHVPVKLKASGRFEVPLSDDWWTRDDHFPFFIRRGDELAGFALVRRGSRLSDARDVMDVAEFFVVRGARRTGLGARAVHDLFRKFPGNWEIRVRKSNTSAQAFWSRATETWLGARLPPEPYELDGAAWQAFRLRT